jgi:hypothetical protein
MGVVKECNLYNCRKAGVRQSFSTSRFEMESDFTNSLLLHKHYFEKYSEIFRKIKNQYEMAIYKDPASEYLNTTLDLSGSLNGAIISR